MSRTWYSVAFGDGFAPEVAFLVLSEARRARVERVIDECMGRGPRRFGVRALTLASAAAALAHVVTPPATAPPPLPTTAAPQPSAPWVRTVAIDRDLARRLHSGMSVWIETYHAMRYRLRDHASRCPSRFALPAPPVQELNAFADLIWHRLLGLPIDRAKEQKT